MKKLAMLFMLGMVCTVKAYEIPENPDRKISIGFTFDRYALKGDYNSPATFPIPAITLKDAGTYEQNNFKGDLRIPLSPSLTFSIGGGYTKTDLGLDLVSRDERWEMKGYNLSVGARYYLP